MKSLAVKYRPQKFEDVLGQQNIIKILQRQIDTHSIKNAYLFSGSSGCGKTTVAKIFAKEVNEGIINEIDIDAASNNGVENVRNIVEEASQRSIGSKYKIYIIDECHMLTTTAWQPFLKILENMPEYTIFIFCTTEPQKVPQTILNRVQRFNFTRVSNDLIKERLRQVCKKEGYTNYETSIDYISKVSNGCVREALTLLDKVADFSTDITLRNTIDTLDDCSYETYFKLLNAMIDDNESEVLNTIESVYKESTDLKVFIDNFLKFNLDIVKYSLFNTCDVISIPSYLEQEIRNVINFEGYRKYYNDVIDKLLDLKNMLKTEIDVKSVVEVVCLQIARL